MGIRTVFLSAKGRIGRGDFWIGWMLLLVLVWVLRTFGLIGDLLGVFVGYPQICLFVKRLHDRGKSGWWAALPTALGSAAIFLADVLKALEPRIATGDTVALVQIAGAFVVVALAIAGAVLFLRAALARGQAEANTYGPPPTAILVRLRRARAAV